jgi:septum formation protein
MKAQGVASKYPNALILGADTIVVVDSEILGKPTDAEDARRMLRVLSGRAHQVYTGIAVTSAGIEKTACERTDVNFAKLSEKIISRYIETGEPMDKAGAYAIQGKGAPLIKSISGCYFNVVGLPIHRLSVLLEDFPQAMLLTYNL